MSSSSALTPRLAQRLQDGHRVMSAAGQPIDDAKGKTSGFITDHQFL